jgi:antitoxin MazE
MRKSKAGKELIFGLKEIIADSRGAKNLRTTTVEVAEPARGWRKEQIAELRKALFGVSQPVFAAMLSVTVSTVRAWEQGQKSPSGAARRLLEIAALAPEVFARLSKDALAGPKYETRTWVTHSQVADRPEAIDAIVQKWGNSLALRIPGSVAKAINLRQGSAVEVTVEDGRLIVRPAKKSKPALSRLLKGAAAANRHREQDWGADVGKEDDQAP